MLPPSLADVLHEKVPEVATFDAPLEGVGDDGVVGFDGADLAVMVIGFV